MLACSAARDLYSRRTATVEVIFCAIRSPILFDFLRLSTAGSSIVNLSIGSIDIVVDRSSELWRIGERRRGRIQAVRVRTLAGILNGAIDCFELLLSEL